MILTDDIQYATITHKKITRYLVECYMAHMSLLNWVSYIDVGVVIPWKTKF